MTGVVSSIRTWGLAAHLSGRVLALRKALKA